MREEIHFICVLQCTDTFFRAILHSNDILVSEAAAHLLVVRETLQKDKSAVRVVLFPGIS